MAHQFKIKRMYDDSGFILDLHANHMLVNMEDGEIRDAECGFPYDLRDDGLYDWAGNEIILTDADMARLRELAA